MDVIEKISLAGIVPVIKVENADDAVPLCKALADGGLPVAEITFRTDTAEEAIRRVHNGLPEVILGAGTVLTQEQVDRAVAAGASYIVSPGLNRDVVKYCQQIGVPMIPGTSTPSEIEAALSLGLKTVKFFPAEAVGGVKAIKAMSAPYGAVNYLPTGGINESNLLDYLSFPKVLACGGSWMVDQQAIASKDWKRIEKLTRSAVELMLGLELQYIGFNSGSPEKALKDAELLGRLFGWEIKDGSSSVLVGSAFELLKKPGKGRNGLIAIGCNQVERAKWHFERRGYELDEESIVAEHGKLMAIDFADDVFGFTFRLVQK